MASEKRSSRSSRKLRRSSRHHGNTGSEHSDDIDRLRRAYDHLKDARNEVGLVRFVTKTAAGRYPLAGIMDRLDKTADEVEKIAERLHSARGN